MIDMIQKLGYLFWKNLDTSREKYILDKFKWKFKRCDIWALECFLMNNTYMQTIYQQSKSHWLQRDIL